MNVVFLSPHFPPNYYLFCTALREQGATVLGLSDQPAELLHPALRAVLHDYYRVSDLHSYDELLRALGYFTYRYGKIDRLDSLNEHWLELEAHLRSDFNIPGFRLADLPTFKRKSEMKRRFAEAGIPTAPGLLIRNPAEARHFVAEVGFPIVAKPDIGVGASRTFTIFTHYDLDAFLAGSWQEYLLEAYVQGVIQTFDGLADRRGDLAFFTSMQYSSGVMEVVNGDTDVYYYTQRTVAPDLEQAGRAIVKAFAVRERLFHFEFFRTPNGQLVALEVNMRPPGGLSMDMFNYANNFDLYRGWARMLVHGHFEAGYGWPFHTCFVGRKQHKPYRYTHAEVLARYGPLIVHHQPMASVFHRAMGDYGYILRSPTLNEVVMAAQEMQATIA